MNTSPFIETLVTNTGKKLHFILPDQTEISGDLHITEIQHHTVNSVDCGGNPHSYNETVFQLSLNERSKNEVTWTTDKAIKIIDIVSQKSSYKDHANLLIEYGDTSHPTTRYSIERIDTTPDDVSILMIINPTVCKPSLIVGKQLASCC